MNYSSFMSKLGGVVLAAVTSLFIITSAQAQNLYFDPNNTQTETAGGSGSFSGSSYYNGTSPQAYSDGSNTIFNGTAGTVTVDSPVNPNSITIGVTTGTEIFATTDTSVNQITFNEGGNNTPISINSSTTPGAENVEFDSTINYNIATPYYNSLYVNSYTSGNVTFNGLTFSNYTTDGDSVGEPNMGITLNTAGGTATLNGAVVGINEPGATPIANYPYINFGVGAANLTGTLTLTKTASFTNSSVTVESGTVLDQGASFGGGPGYQVVVGGTGQYLTDAANTNVTANIVFNNGGGTIGGKLADETTFSGQEIVGYSGANTDLTAAAGGRVDFTGDIHNGNGLSIVKVGAGTIVLNDTQGRAEDQNGAWEVQNGTLLLNGTYNANNYLNTSITGSQLTIDDTAATMSSPATHGILGGIGSTNVPIVAAGGSSVIAPGDPEVNSGIGTLTLLGGLTANMGATFQLQLNGANTVAHDQLAFAGSILNAATTTLTFDLSNIGGALTDAGGSSSLVFNAAKAYTLFTGLGAGSTLGTDSFAFDAPAGYFVSNYQYNALNGTFAVDIRAVPEPSTYALMIGGLAFLAFCIRRKGVQVK